MTEHTHDEAVKKVLSNRFKTYAIWFLVGALMAFIASTAIRFAIIKDTAVHHHANFALYINGTRDEFKSFTFYEEVAACDANSTTNPKVRAHLHDKNGQLIHVHDGGVTWGNLFENLGYSLSNDLVQNDNGVYIGGDDGNKLTFLLNGESVDSIANKLISSEDKLLINYGKDDQGTLEQRYDNIPNDAGVANVNKDPSACAGTHELTFWERFKRALGTQPASN